MKKNDNFNYHYLSMKYIFKKKKITSQYVKCLKVHMYVTNNAYKYTEK